MASEHCVIRSMLTVSNSSQSIPMSGIRFQACKTRDQLDQILALQSINLEGHPGQASIPADGFVTVRHEPQVLHDMNDAAPHIIAIADDQVVGYALVMLREFDQRVPILQPMFRRLVELDYQGRPVTDFRYFIMGQVCVARAFRGRGVFVGMYHAMRDHYSADNDMVITEVATRNTRSIAAHRKVGFELLHRYIDQWGERWDLVVWDWR